MLRLEFLNPQQLEAVMHTEGALLIVAGAGSGKTRVLTTRIAHLCENLAVAPWNILAVTFTNKAAKEMLGRVEQVLEQNMSGMWVKTFHSACLMMLRRDIVQLGYDKNFTIYDAGDQLVLVKECLKRLNIADEDNVFSPRSCLAHISKAKDVLVEPHEYCGVFGTGFPMDIHAKVYDLYQTTLRTSNSVDFDDIINLTVKLLEKNEEIRSFYQRKFRYILVDEFQDTNQAQYKLLKLLAGADGNICAVGDDDQSIYKFRGANVGNMYAFERDFKRCKTILLEQNYRSTTTILDAANAIISHNESRKSKKLWSALGKGEKIAYSTLEDSNGEACYIADEIYRLAANKDMDYNACAVLYRTNAQSRALEEMLIRRGVPYRILSGTRFYERAEIKDVLAYLKLINNVNDNVCFTRIVNTPRRGIGLKALSNLNSYATRVGLSHMEALAQEEAAEHLGNSTYLKFKAFFDLIHQLKDCVQALPVSGFVKLVLERSGYIQLYSEAEDDIEKKARLENIQEFVSYAVNYETTAESPSFSDFLDGISLISDVDNYDENDSAVTLMTLHSAKGLEFDYVFMCGMEDGLLPSSKAMYNPDDVEEERRLCYVGITRAKKQLYLTNANMRNKFGKIEVAIPSQFINELPKHLLQEVMPPAKRPVATPYKPQHSQTSHYQQKSAYKPNSPITPLNQGFRDSYKAGDIVVHPKFGKGTVMQVESVGNDYALRVDFEECGPKQLLATYAKLKKISS